jgi:hypothetical protein
MLRVSSVIRLMDSPLAPVRYDFYTVGSSSFFSMMLPPQGARINLHRRKSPYVTGPLFVIVTEGGFIVTRRRRVSGYRLRIHILS